MRDEELVPVERDDAPPTMLRGIREGLAFAWRTPQVRLVLAIVTVVSTVGFNFHVLLPLLASDTLAARARRSSASSRPRSAPARCSARCSRPRSAGRAGRCSCSAPAASASSLLALAPLTTVWPCAVLLFVTGACFTLWTSNANAILQLGAPDHLRGRVVSLYLLAFAGLAPFGGLLAGWLVDVGGTQLSFSVAGMHRPGDDAARRHRAPPPPRRRPQAGSRASIRTCRLDKRLRD